MPQAALVPGEGRQQCAQDNSKKRESAKQRIPWSRDGQTQNPYPERTRGFACQPHGFGLLYASCGASASVTGTSAQRAASATLDVIGNPSTQCRSA
jgi:hypothetical protein